MRVARITTEEALSFLLTHIVVERNHAVELTPLSLLNLMNSARMAEDRINKEEGVIPHEVLEEIANDFITNDK